MSAPEASQVTPPIPYARLQHIANEACNSALSSATSYDHPSTSTWNTQIINTILKALISESAPSSSAPSTFKFAVNSTIIQHPILTTRAAQAANTSASPQPPIGLSGSASGRRGMHSATGAYWNNEKDGMWSFKYEAGEAKGLDVVISVIWIALA